MVITLTLTLTVTITLMIIYALRAETNIHAI